MELADATQRILEQIQDSIANMNARFDAVDARFDTVDARLDRLERGVVANSEILGLLKNRQDFSERAVAAANEGRLRLESQVDRLESRVDALEHTEDS
ncbi:MAG: hypothetical protein AAGF11_26785 [Myxococcota bacterium]